MAFTRSRSLATKLEYLREVVRTLTTGTVEDLEKILSENSRAVQPTSDGFLLNPCQITLDIVIRDQADVIQFLQETHNVDFTVHEDLLLQALKSNSTKILDVWLPQVEAFVTNGLSPTLLLQTAVRHSDPKVISTILDKYFVDRQDVPKETFFDAIQSKHSEVLPFFLHTFPKTDITLHHWRAFAECAALDSAQKMQELLEHHDAPIPNDTQQHAFTRMFQHQSFKLIKFVMEDAEDNWNIAPKILELSVSRMSGTVSEESAKYIDKLRYFVHSQEDFFKLSQHCQKDNDVSVTFLKQLRLQFFEPTTLAVATKTEVYSALTLEQIENCVGCSRDGNSLYPDSQPSTRRI